MTAAALDTGDPLAPFSHPGFRADLALLASAERRRSVQLAEDLAVLARLADRVPRVPGDERGGTAWTSFLREVAVARRCSDRSAAADVALAQQVVGHLPLLLRRLQDGELPSPVARAVAEQTYGAGPAALQAVDQELADRTPRLSPSRAREAVRRVLLRVEADAVAAQAARAGADRHVRRTPLAHDQAELALVGPALTIAQARAALDADARALRAAGDARTLEALRFDLAVERLLGQHARPLDGPEGLDVPVDLGAPADPTAPGWLTDRRWSRPVRLDVTVPVETALGLSDEPGWLEGHGWLSAPTCRQLQVAAELRRLCVDALGRLLDVAPRCVRPALDPTAVAAALLDMATHPFDVTDTSWASQPQHDPSPALRELVVLRDRECDGPTGTRTSARRGHLDHGVPWPDGPTAAWNLVARGARTHQLKHRGWTPVRSTASTVWFSPAGQVVEVPHALRPPPDLPADAEVPDPVLLHDLEAELLRPPGPDDEPPGW